MFLTFNRKIIVNTALLAVFVSTVLIYASSGGIVGKTLKNGSGCTCHGSSPTGGVVVSISGPDTLNLGATGTYTVTISGGPLAAGGTNIAASNGNLLPVSGDLRIESGELTHTSPKSPVSGQVTFQFTYTAPSSVGTQTIFANGNSVNNSGSNNGDQWNFAPNKIVTVKQPTSVDNENLASSSFELNQNYPNPFNPSTIISWQSSVGSRQGLKVFDILGNEVATLLDEWKEAGSHSVSFDASALPSGVYLYRIQAGSFVEIKKMILAK